MNRVLRAVVLGCVLPVAAAAQAAPDAAELTELLQAFLSGVNNVAVHEAFWAEDLIYTRSSGVRIGKADILRDMRAAPAPSPEDPVTAYAAQDVRIQQYGNTAIVAFQLVATTDAGGTTEILKFLNTGTFVKRDGTWRVVAWQATRVPPTADEVERDVAAAGSAFQDALRRSDAEALGSLLHEDFVWTNGGGDEFTGPQVIECLHAGNLRNTQPGGPELDVSVHGDAGIVRGAWSTKPDGDAGGVAEPDSVLTSFTLVFAREGGAWKAVAMHSSEP